jgi:hypothetical protein
MNTPGGPSNVREALLAEALGDLGQLLQRAEAVEQAMAVTAGDLREARLQLAAQMNNLDRELGSLTRKAQAAAVQHILDRTDLAAKRTIEAQTQAMEAAAQALFARQLQPALQRVATLLQQRTPASSVWQAFATHALAVVLTAAGSWGLAAWLWAGPR